jgi:hypothetical protein
MYDGLHGFVLSHDLPPQLRLEISRLHAASGRIELQCICVHLLAPYPPELSFSSFKAASRSRIRELRADTSEIPEKWESSAINLAWRSSTFEGE